MPSAQGAGEAIAVPGSVASPALAALGPRGTRPRPRALAIAGPGIRIVLGVLEVLLGGCILLATGISIGDPVAAVAPAVTDATGVSGSGPTAELVAAATGATAWPAAAIVGESCSSPGSRCSSPAPAGPRRPAGTAARGSPTPTRVAGHDAARAASDRAIDDWDELSRGDDPTADDVASPDDADAAARHRRRADDRRPRRPGGEGRPPAARLAPKPRNEGAS